MKKLNTDGIRIYDLYDIWYKPIWKNPVFIVILVILAVVFFVGIVYLAVKKYHSRKILPWDKALNAIKQVSLAQDTISHQAFYFKITAILKEYLHNQYGLDLKGKTDSEILTIVAQNNLPSEVGDILAELFNGSIRIRYANELAAAQLLKDDLNRANALVRLTIPAR